MCAQSNQTPHRGINRVAAACWIIGTLGLVGALTGIKRIWYGPELTIAHHAPAERAIVAAIGLGAVIVGFGCRRRRPYAWWTLAGLVIAFILGAGWQLVRNLAAPWPTPLFGTLEALVQLGPAALLLWWWWLQRPAFSLGENKSDATPPTFPVTPSKDRLANRFAVLLAVTVCFVAFTWGVVLYRSG